MCRRFASYLPAVSAARQPSAGQQVSRSAGPDISTAAHQWVSCEFGKSEAGEHCDRGIDIHCRPLGQDYEDGPRFPHCSSSASRRGCQGWQTVAEVPVMLWFLDALFLQRSPGLLEGSPRSVCRSRPHDVHRMISRRSGGERQLSVPRTCLKAVQRWIRMENLDRIKSENAAHGSVRGRSVVTNAVQHCRQALVPRMDLANFFPSIGYGRVRSVRADASTVVCRASRVGCTFDTRGTRTI
jgi:hypothetical protein